MDLLAAFGIFLVCVVGCMIKGFSLFWALLAGLFCFLGVGFRRGFSASALLKMTVGGMRTAKKVLVILILVGILTATWRAGGTVAFFVCKGARLITPNIFVLEVFLLVAAFSAVFGSSFGVVGTAGVIFMAIARSGDANLIAAAGAIMSGIYFGERLSPASSAAAFVAALSEVDQHDFQMRMWRDTLVPLCITIVFYGVLSALYPIREIDAQIVSALEQGYSMTWVAILPAAALLILPFLHVKAEMSIAVSCILAAGCALFVQGMPPEEMLRACVMGYHPPQPALAELMSGGGIISMTSVCLIVILSCAYSGIFNGTGLLAPVVEQADRLAQRIGLFGAHVVVSLCCCALFCNQTVAIVMSKQLLEKEYKKNGLSNLEMAANIGNTAVNLAAVIPWSIACSMPLATLESSTAALPAAIYLYILTLWCWLRTLRKKPAGLSLNGAAQKCENHYKK